MRDLKKKSMIIPMNTIALLSFNPGGMFALGAHVDSRDPEQSQKERDMEIGRNFTNTCHESYIRSTTKIGTAYLYLRIATE